MKRTLIVVAALAMAHVASATVIIGGAVGNGNFEDLTGGSIMHGNGTRVYSNVSGAQATIPGWTSTQNTGGYVSFDTRTDGLDSSGAALGANVAYSLNSWTGANLVSDTYAATINVGDLVTLSYQIGNAGGESNGVWRAASINVVFDQGLGTEQTVVLNHSDAGNSYAGDFAYNNPPYQYSDPLTFSYTATDSFTTATLVFDTVLNRAPSTGQLDNVELTVVPEPATMGLMGIAGGAILFFRRRYKI